NYFDCLTNKERNSFPLTGPYACLNRLVVHPGYSRMGYARELDNARLKFAQSQKCGTILAWAHDRRRVSKLAGYGFAVVATIHFDGFPYPIHGLCLSIIKKS